MNQMRCSLVLVLILTLPNAASLYGVDEAVSEKAIKLFANETWYKQQAGKEQLFEGVLEKEDRRGRIGFGRFNPFLLKMKDDTREVYMGGQLKKLEPYVKMRVRLRGKAVEIGVEGTRHREIWPAELVVLRELDAADEEADVDRAIKARLAGKQKGGSVMRQAAFILEDDPTAETLVLRTGEDLDKAFDESMRKAVKSINLDEIDFTKHMVVVVKSGRANAFGVRVTIDRVDVAADGKSATIQWTHRPYFGGAAPPERIGNPGAIALVERFDGDLHFKKNVYRWPRGLPPPPSAPPSPK